MRDLALESLAGFPARLERCLAAFPHAWRDWRPVSWEGIPSERLTAIEQACHVRDIEREGYHLRFQRVLREDTPVLPDIPGEQLAIERGYAKADLGTVLRDFQAARAETIAMLSGLSDAELARQGIFEGQPTTLAGLVQFLCSHDQQHLAGLHWLLAKRSALA